MDFFGVLTMLGGLALFLYGMHILGDGLSKLSGGRLEKILEKLTSNPIKAVLLGAGVTAVIQSSSATTVMVVGFVNSGIMKLAQAVGIIMGANIGTTITSWILSLAGIESSNFFVSLLKPSSFSPVLAAIGVIFVMFSKKAKKHDIGAILLGFAVLMIGMETMSGAVKPLADVPEFTNILTLFSNPVFGMLAGAFLTAVIQSSSASVGILQALSVTGSLSYGVTIPIIMGQNIGTCITAILSGIGANKNAKRAALVHLYFNLIGTIVFMIGFYSINAFVDFAFLDQVTGPAGIAIVHTLFNIFATLCLLPFRKLLVKLATMSIRDNEEESQAAAAEEKMLAGLQILDPRFLEMPSYAISECKEAALSMANLAKEALFKAIDLLSEYNKSDARRVQEIENVVDRYDDEIGSYLTRISSKTLSEKDSHTVTILQHCIGDFERISDHALNLMQTAKEMHEKESEFSKKAVKELAVFTEAVKEITSLTIEVFESEDSSLAQMVEPLEDVVDYLRSEMKKRHLKRLRKGRCTIEMGFVLSEILTNYERVSDHCSNIAVYMLQVNEEGLEMHDFLDTVRRQDNEWFKMQVATYKEKYLLP